MSSSNCCFLTCIQIYREAGQVIWYSHLFQNFSQFIVIPTVKGFGIINKAEIDVFLELSCFFYDSTDVGNLISGSSAFLYPAWTSGSSWFTSVEDCLENFEHYFASVWDKYNCAVVWTFFGIVFLWESWTIKKAEHWRIDAFELCYWRRLLRVPWTARRSNQSILKEISPE